MLTETYRYPRADGIIFGIPWQEAMRTEVDRIGARRIFAVVSSSLLAAAALETSLRRALGELFAGLADGIRAHSPREDVARVAVAARDAKADLLVAIGGGSVADAAKVAQLCLARAVFSGEVFSMLCAQNGMSRPRRRLSRCASWQCRRRFQAPSSRPSPA